MPPQEVRRGLSPGEMLPPDQQQRNFAKLHGLLMGWGIQTTYSGRLAMLDAFRNASDSPVDFHSMASLDANIIQDSGVLEVSNPYFSHIRGFEPVRTDTAYHTTRIAALRMQDVTRFSIMRIIRVTDDGVLTHVSSNANGLYMAQDLQTHEVSYFGVRSHPDGGEGLQIIEKLPDQLEIAMMHDVASAIAAM